jgi:hypothetical protein
MCQIRVVKIFHVRNITKIQIELKFKINIIKLTKIMKL